MAGDVNGPGGKAVHMILRGRVLKHHRVGRPLGRILSLFCREDFTCPQSVLWDALSLVAAERRELVSCVEVWLGALPSRGSEERKALSTPHVWVWDSVLLCFLLLS